ncbi:uncharacterized protein M6B38_317865 [Iris pallida]|uniref:Uncharacterized protein n=1 Tax=Iris pallida TaxID=29817 RepID=A0AAX6HD66_IRIPA|nr:uncharacterized protein M6B38_317865 [Iris pallida]
MSSSSLLHSSSEIIKNRYLGFLIWQSLATAPIHLLLSPSPRPLLPPPPPLPPPPLPLPLSPLFPAPPPPPPPLLLSSLLKSLIAGGGSSPSSADARHRSRRTLASAAFLLASAMSGSLAVAAVAGRRGGVLEAGAAGAARAGVGADYLYRRRWVFGFPIIQRTLYYSFKMGLSSSAKQALKLSTVSFFSSTVLMIFLPDQFKSKTTRVQFIIQLIYFYVGMSAVSFCWELSHHLLQVMHTKRCSFAPPQGSAAAETNPSEPLLEALEQSSPRSLLQYLAYLDLCMVSESNVEPWRRAAFFEETGETYRRIISVCLRPLEQLTSRLAEGLEGISKDKSDMLSQQLISPTDSYGDSRLHEAFNDLQVCTWSARTVAALTARSRWEDRYGVAQLTSCNSTVVSTLLCTLMAVEVCLGKKTSPQPAQFMGPANIRWATGSTGRRDIQTATPSKKRGSALYGNAYALADVLRTSIYEIVSAFQADMQGNAKALLEKNWIVDGKPLYGTREILVQKLSLFLDFRAN